MSDAIYGGDIVGRPRVSVEYFPAAGLIKERALATGAHALRRFDPDFQTVTFGAGDSPTEGSLEWSSKLSSLTEIPTASHLTLCAFDTKAELFAFADELWEAGIRHLVVLRGDGEGANNGLGEFTSVADAMRALRKRRGFEISVAAYPEVHPKAESRTGDIQVLLDKQRAGAARAITQFFFDNDDFLSFRDEARAVGVTMPIVPGIMPIVNAEKIFAFAEDCGAKVPAALRERFASCDDDKAARSDVARDVVQTQVRELAEQGVREIHVYSMNRVDLTADAIRAFQACFTGKDARASLKLVG